ncbi:MAG TPA: septal ring lytic transglycosylase RlpA family protein [Gammaproteobacteria bacterium]|nr:septal ring lytic transglycosylase RlpA family protein [Gammaproteobacteria bacterium]
MGRKRLLLLGVLALGMSLCACAPFPTLPSGDRGPEHTVDVSKVPDAVPGDETPSRSGNPSRYTVLGKTYDLVPSCKGYHDRGIASWYGTQFHGGRTSDGETYDMYAMTAANKVVPIPCYARVTNLQNGKSVVVKINDRGPFVGNRLIDLSYAAASKLEMLGTGTALVDVQAVTAGQASPPPAVAPVPAPAVATVASAAAPAVAPDLNPKIFLQVGAYVERANADAVLQKLAVNGVQKTFILAVSENGRTLYKVRIGPVAGVDGVDSLSTRLAALGYPDAEIVIP